jgi:hypothetical protein
MLHGVENPLNGIFAYHRNAGNARVTTSSQSRLASLAIPLSSPIPDISRSLTFQRLALAAIFGHPRQDFEEIIRLFLYRSVLCGSDRSTATWCAPKVTFTERLPVKSVPVAIRQRQAERHPTLWFRKNKDNHYHIDCAFLSRPLLSKLRNVVVGPRDDWLSFSDHAPVLVELDL